MHIRSDINAGITEAKLLEESCEDCEPANPIEVYKNDDLMQRIGKEFQQLDAQARDEEREFRTYHQLKAEMKKLNISIEDDPTAIKNLVNRFEELMSQDGMDNSDELMVILMDLEYHLHQIDNAQFFFKQNGLKRIIFPAIQLPDGELQKQALRLLSASCQHNPSVQLEAVNGDTIAVLYNLLDSEDQSVVISTLGTISNVIRKFPSAQLAFLRYGAFKKIFNLLQDYKYVTNHRFTTKVLTLMLDYYEDNDNHYIQTTKDKVSAEHSQLVKNHFETHFKEDGWCEMIKTFVYKVDHSNFDIVERIFPLMDYTKDICKREFQDEELKTFVAKILKYYDKREQREIKDSKENSKEDQLEEGEELYITELNKKLKNYEKIIFATDSKKLEHSEL